MVKGPSISDQIYCLNLSQTPHHMYNAPLASRSSSRSTPSMDIQVPDRLDVAHPCLWFLSITIFRMNSDYIFTLFYSCVTILVMVALNEIYPKLASGNKVPVEILIFCLIFVNWNFAIIDISPVEATCSSFPYVVEQVAAKRYTGVHSWWYNTRISFFIYKKKIHYNIQIRSKRWSPSIMAFKE
jgi:hypothetical protein